MQSFLGQKKYIPASFLPTNKKEMQALGWSSCDIIFINGDAYIDHPAFGVSLLGRFLESHGFRVGIIPQPDCNREEDFSALGAPNLFFGISSGNMDSMVNHYTSAKKIRSQDAYSPNNERGKRPNRAVLVYSQIVKKNFPQSILVIGGIEASLRRLAHYDFWSDKIRRSILADTKAHILLYGNAERAILQLARALQNGTNFKDLLFLDSTAILVNPSEKQNYRQAAQENKKEFVSLPEFSLIQNDKNAYADYARILHHHINRRKKSILLQETEGRYVAVNAPAEPLRQEEMDFLYALPFARAPHPIYAGQKISAWEMIRFSLPLMRGCFGGCSFCSITAHEGKIIQSRSQNSVEQEINLITQQKDFRGSISDLGGPSANMYNMNCRDPKVRETCGRLSCLYPNICKFLNTDHSSLLRLYKKVSQHNKVKHVSIASGIRYDLALQDANYVKEVAQKYTGGFLKLAPEHSEEEVLSLMLKPSVKSFEEFRKKFQAASIALGKEQYIIPYLIAAHPGSTILSMLKTALWLKKNKMIVEQVQIFLPTPMALASDMYYTGINLLKQKETTLQKIYVAYGEKERQLQKEILLYHKKESRNFVWHELRQKNRFLLAHEKIIKELYS